MLFCSLLFRLFLNTGTCTCKSLSHHIASVFWLIVRITSIEWIQLLFFFGRLGFQLYPCNGTDFIDSVRNQPRIYVLLTCPFIFWIIYFDGVQWRISSSRVFHLNDGCQNHLWAYRKHTCTLRRLLIGRLTCDDKAGFKLLEKSEEWCSVSFSQCHTITTWLLMRNKGLDPKPNAGILVILGSDAHWTVVAAQLCLRTTCIPFSMECTHVSVRHAWQRPSVTIPWSLFLTGYICSHQ